MNFKDLKNTQQLQTFLEGTQAIVYSVPGDKLARYTFIQTILKQFHYRALKKPKKGIVIRFLLQASDWLFQATINTLDSAVSESWNYTTQNRQ